MFDKLGDYDGTAILLTDAFFCRNPEDARFLLDTPLFNAVNASPAVPLKREAKAFAARFSQLKYFRKHAGQTPARFRERYLG